MEKINSHNLPIHNPIDLLKKMSHAFEVFFDEFGINWIKNMYNALKMGEDVLPISENEQGSFFFQFVDFHHKAFEKNDFNYLDPKLQEFCEVCGKIESLTDRWPILEQEPATEDKKRLFELIEKFLSIFPSPEILERWISISIENLSQKQK
jgi:hypothetical protein